jgi:hypothetical protein
MRASFTPLHRVCAGAAVLLAAGGLGYAAQTSSGQAATTFSAPTKIDNPYLPLAKYRRCDTRGTSDEGDRLRTVRTRLSQTKAFDIAGQRVEAAIYRDNDYQNGKLTESTFDYYVQADDSTVYYLGEQVRNIRSGKVVNTRGTWLYGKDTDRMGVAMPPAPTLGAQWHFEDVPGTTTESDRVEETGLRTKVMGTVMTDVIRVQEFIQPEGEYEHKLYARGVGLVAEYAPGERATLRSCQ